MTAGVVVTGGAHRARRPVVTCNGANTALLAAGVFSAFLFPAQLAFGTSGLSFRIASVVGLLGLVLALCGILAVHAPQRVTTVDPVVIALLVYAAYAVFSFGRLQFQPAPANDNGPVRSLVLTLGAAGIGVLAASSFRDRQSLWTVLAWTLGGGYLSAFVALGQKLFNMPYASLWRNVPGLQTDNLGTRTTNLVSGRAFGTAGHPIELSVVSVVLFAFAIHLAKFHPTRGGRQFHTVGSALLVIGALLAVSRSGFIALAIVLVVLLAYSAGRQRASLALLIVLGLGLTEALSPRSISTLRYQLSHIGTDNSSKGRTSDYGPIIDAWHQNRWFGEGFGVADVTQTRILDNAWLGQLSNGGLVAVILLAAVFVLGIGKAALWVHRYRYDLPDPELRSAMASSLAALLALMVSAYFFDELSFFQAQTIVFLVAGLIAAAPFGAVDIALAGRPEISVARRASRNPVLYVPLGSLSEYRGGASAGRRAARRRSR